MSRSRLDQNLYARNSLRDSYSSHGPATVDNSFFQEGNNPNTFFISPVDFARGNEVLEWLDEQGLGHLPTMYLGFVEITFPNSDDAVMFKLVFG